ncbi:uncharacterized protein RSE6_01593 [Rhynchosporium secalis]|uniref:DUF676 domain-containing protein n=1 Tax=Rhynchosporium secalis TaxID=38038 RepID=A0A1E1LY61_RHYSE|nr:uncharacterized protein RSE6_01593 [Rhynchosporium secalis]
MATQAQLDEKARKDRAGATVPTLESLATPAQVAEKLRQDRAGASSASEFATSAQLAEKARQDDPYSSFATLAQLAEKPRGRAPPLPPRIPSAQIVPPPPYTSDDAGRSQLISEQWRSEDPRSSSTHSLVPSESGRDGRRTLLLIFIHGFMGNETSFRSFPAHVHNLLSITLSESHVVHTKIYPRYKSRKVIDFARDDFSTWLEPHENTHTDVMLLGHSMGGLLSAEVALQKPSSLATGKPFRHRLLGTINFDTPFLGMHPGVVMSGVGSLFRPTPEPLKPLSSIGSGTNTPALDGTSQYAPSTVTNDSSLSLVQSITSPLASPRPKDPFFNAPFPNDVRIAERSGWANILHFVNKHSDGLTAATKQYFVSHLEFGGCMADYPGLKNRYERIRALEDVDDTPKSGPEYQAPSRRVRFVNYYTASTGRPKQPKVTPDEVADKDGELKAVEGDMDEMSLEDETQALSSHSTTIEQRDGTTYFEDTSPIEIQMQDLGENSAVQDDVQELKPMQHVDSMPTQDDEDILSDIDEEEPYIQASTAEPTEPDIQRSPVELPLPPILSLPTEPSPVDLDAYTDKDSRKIAEREQKRIIKAYQQALKDRESAIRDRKKLVEKREKKVRQEQEKEEKAKEKKRLKEENEEEKRKEKLRVEEEKQREKQRLEEEKEEKKKATMSPKPRTRQASSPGASSKEEGKSKRDKKFCMLPPEYGGKRDKCWIRVYMEGVDEVGAHCGLFFPGPQYESLVGDVGERIGKWVEEDATKRAVREAAKS